LPSAAHPGIDDAMNKRSPFLFALALVLLLPALTLAANGLGANGLGANAPANGLRANAPANAGDNERPDLERLFAKHGLTGCFVVERPDGTTRINPARAKTPFRPASTFKIINALTAFENGVAPDTELVMKWDGVKHALPAWNQDLSLERAFRVSAVWFFVELGKRNGRERLAETMRRLDYGTADASGSDQFWIDGPLAISADGQVRALGRLARGEAGFAPRSLNFLRQIMLLGQGTGPDGPWRLYGKTGMAPRKSDAEPAVGWFVGWVERAGRVIPFALNASPLDPAASPTPAQFQARVEVAKDVLTQLGVLPAK